MRRAIAVLAAFAALVVAIEALHVLVAWWKAGRETPGSVEWLAMGALALIVALWWRISVFGQASPRCLMPDGADDRPGNEPRR